MRRPSVGNRVSMSEGVSPHASLVRLAAFVNLLLEEIERSEHQHLTTERFKTDVRALAARVEAELDAASKQARLHLAEEGGSVVTDD